MVEINPKTAAKGLTETLEEFAKKKKEYESTKLRCGLVGRSGVGKSSLINAITGDRLAPVGAGKETTVEAHEYWHRGLGWVDLPGCGTEKFPTADYVKRLKLSSYDFFIFVTESRFFQDDKVVYSQLANDLKKPCYLVRSKFDEAVSNAAHDESGLTEGELKEDICRNIRENLAPLHIEKVYMVSARRPTHYDLPELQDDIQSSFDGVKRLRLENDMAAWSTDALEKKRANAMTIVSWYAAAAGANGLNPIPGLDLSIDVKILKDLCREVSEIYGLTKEQADYWERMLKSPHGKALLQKAVALTLRYGTEAAIMTVIKTIGKREVPKKIAKYIPFVGPVLAAGAGFGLTYYFGKSLVDEYHEMAAEMLEQLASSNEDS